VEEPQRIEVILASDRRLEAKRVLLATGAQARTLGVPGEHLAENVGSPRQEAERYGGQSVVVIGAGDEACDTAASLAECGARVTLLVRSSVRARNRFADPLRGHATIDVRLGSRVVGLEGAERLEAVALEGGERVSAEACFVRIGVEPVLPIVSPPLRTLSGGLVWVDEVGRTSVPSVFCAGDLVRPAAQRYVASAMGDGVVIGRQVEADLRR
jgi:thioredoxin reductase